MYIARLVSVYVCVRIEEATPKRSPHHHKRIRPHVCTLLCVFAEALIVHHRATVIANCRMRPLTVLPPPQMIRCRCCVLGGCVSCTRIPQIVCPPMCDDMSSDAELVSQPPGRPSPRRRNYYTVHVGTGCMRCPEPTEQHMRPLFVYVYLCSQCFASTFIVLWRSCARKGIIIRNARRSNSI